MYQGRTFLLIFFLVIVFPFSLTAQEKFQAIKWEVKDGRSGNFANSIIKDIYGFTWIGHQTGVDRFDGNQFITYNGGGLGLVEDSLNNIWLGSADGLHRIDIRADTASRITSSRQLGGNRFVIPFWATSEAILCVENGSKITSYNIHTLARKTLLDTFHVAHQDFYRYHFSILDPRGKSVWILEHGGVSEMLLSTGGKTHFPPPEFGKRQHAQLDAPGMCWDPKRKRIWINSTVGLLEFDPLEKKYNSSHADYGLLQNPGYDVYPGISVAPDGRVWYAIGPPRGIQIYDPERNTVMPAFSDQGLQEMVSSDNMVLHCDRDGMIWAGKWSNKGLFQINPATQAVQEFSTDVSNPHFVGFNSVGAITTALSRRLWLASGMGIREFDPITGIFSSPEKKVSSCFGSELIIGVVMDTIVKKAWAVLPFPLRVLEMNLATGNCREIEWKNAEGNSLQLPHWRVVSAIPFRDGALISVRGIGIFMVSNKNEAAQQIIKFKDEQVTAIATDGEKYLFEKFWGTSRNRTHILENGNWRQVNTPLDEVPWYCISFDVEDQTFWVGGVEFLREYQKDFRVKTIVENEAGLKSVDILNLLPDKSHNIWFNTGNGLLMMWDKAAKRLIRLSEKDGYTRQVFGWNNPRVRDSYGNLYFAGDEGLEVINPSMLQKQYAPSQIYFRSLEINDSIRHFPAGINELKELSLPYDQNTFALATGSIDYYSKGQNRIRYKLQGLNDNWQYGPDYNIIKYNDLPPNDYRLIIQAANVLDVFNGPEKVLVIHIAPPFWQTWWFRTAAVVGFVSLLYGIYLWRTSSLRKQKRILEQTVKERTQEVVAEKAEVERQKEKSDELLLNILPFEVAEELKEKGYTTARAFDSATVLFSDIKGFTYVAEKLSAQELVQEINVYFSAFDRIMQQYGLEKIKTIGDAYIAAGGLPDGNTAEAVRVVQAAIAMLDAVKELAKERNKSGRPYFEVRIGIHTGPVVAGVVGIKKFQYDIWGDAVNLAARMEQSGEPGKINISQDTYDLVKGRFTCVHRGRIEAKNKGGVDMYFVDMPS